ncbi:uncharacterized protein KY384_005445 [Bacidia gigantensis]|uniref:uncharacterized protein n=1 Tax=Bacidia gigantensis TaxID=2732470 RepID=UPI001D04D7E5|nr:uncharacterized protein KY384_005445 [Bacidia gigantensis]KAG8529963.1 hypothetical protein KY384_005445 [Bacidia gigantensis]
MAASSGPGDEGIFEQLQKGQDANYLEERAKALQAEEVARYERSQRRIEALVLGAQNTRQSFLKRVFDPALNFSKEQPHTLLDAVREVSNYIYQQPISLSINRPDPANASATPTDVDFVVSVREKSRLLLKTGTDVGNAEGSAYVNSWLTRGFGGIISSTQKPWASHEEVLRGGWAKLRWLLDGGSQHELTYNAFWRQVTGLAQEASPTVRAEAGDTVKSSISHAWLKDRRDNPLLPTSGYYYKTLLELAGRGPLKGDVAFGKAEVESQFAVPIPLPGVPGESGISFSTGMRAGFLAPLPSSHNHQTMPSRINDRFLLGGPTDVRGFRLSGLGPHDGKDAVGGDLYAAGSANLFFPIPRIGMDKPFRFQMFMTGGRLLALKASEKEGQDRGVQQRLASAVAEIGNGLPSVSAGFGLVYAAPMARLELNFSLPLVLRKGEEGRKGLSFGVGINLL